MKRWLGALVFLVLGGSVEAQEEPTAPRRAAPVATLPMCPAGVSLQEDETRPGVVLARYEDLPRYGPARCTPYTGKVVWYVTFCAHYQDSNCYTYVDAKPGRRRAVLAFTPAERGQHNVFAYIPGIPDAAQPSRAIYRKR